MTERATLQQRVLAFMDGALQGRPPESFDTLALALHAWQARHDPVLRALAPSPVTRWQDVPAVPVALFKELPIGTAPDGSVAFRTSGTTGSGRGVHRMRDSTTYDHGALAWARRCVPDLPPRIIALLDDPLEVPDSSLSHMVALFAPSAGHASWHVHGGVLDRRGLAAALSAADEPVFVAATAFALAEWLTHAPPASPLPAGSLVMITGGFKGRTVELADDALVDAVEATLQPRRVVTEYGMTELSSQLWGHPGEAYRPPPWLRAVAVDPATARPLPADQAGQLRFYDLANLDSTVGIETLDVGTVLGDGAVALRGRLDGAEARGCSLTVEEAWALRDARP